MRSFCRSKLTSRRQVLLLMLLSSRAAALSTRTARAAMSVHHRTIFSTRSVLRSGASVTRRVKSLTANDAEDEERTSMSFSDPEYDQAGSPYYDTNDFDPEAYAATAEEKSRERQLGPVSFSSKPPQVVPNAKDTKMLQNIADSKVERVVPSRRNVPIPNFSIFEDSTPKPAAISKPVQTPELAGEKIQSTMVPEPLENAVVPVTVSTTHYFPAEGSGDPVQDAEIARAAASGNGGLTLVDTMELDLQKLVEQIYLENGGTEFNINSSKQVSVVLFGSMGGSTEKDVLEAKAAAGHTMSDLVLKYRALKRDISRLKTKKELTDKGLRVKSASKVVRDSPSQQEGSKPIEQSTDPLILIDASAYIFRAYYSMPPIHRGDGMPTGAVLGFCNMLNRLALNDLLSGNTPRLVLVFDAAGKSFRSDIYPAYKGNRPDAPVDLIPQFSFVRQAATAYGIARIEADTFEADDVIATLACRAQEQGIDVNIFSGDKDLMQLVTDKHVQPSIHMIDPATMARVTHDEVVEKWGLPPWQLGDLLALAGDSADNIPGVPGIGPKIAAQLIQEYGTLENLYENVDQVKQKARRAKLENFQHQAFLSRRLVELDRNVPFQRMKSQRDGFTDVADLRMEPMDPDRIISFYTAMGFNDIKRRFQNSLNRGNCQAMQQRPVSKSKWRRPKASIPTPDEYDGVPF
ncbi:hypothetical protein MPSEU_001085500 [Mayamaea pseudoterrestris]|nr:hypothetical protein MPSEU_001085500 [Mayamaea pseudoterrestris]